MVCGKSGDRPCVCVCACVRDFSYISQTYSLIKRVPNETTCCIEYKMVDLLSKSESAGYINGQCVLNGTPRHPLKKKPAIDLQVDLRTVYICRNVVASFG